MPSSDGPTPDSSLTPSAIRQLIRARAVEFIREPAAVFWAYGFPLLMIVALGIAFRSESEEPIVVDIESGPRAESTAEALTQESRFVVSIRGDEEAARRLRVGKTDLVIRDLESSSGPGNGLVYAFDPSKPGSELAKRLVDDRIQREAGRQDVIVTQSDEVTEPGGRYIDFLIPGLLGMGLMGGGAMGCRFCGGRPTHSQIDEAVRGDADASFRFFGLYPGESIDVHHS